MADETTLTERQRLQLAEADLATRLCEHIWAKDRPLRLGGEEWEVPYLEDIPPGYEDGDVVLLRRKSDGSFFEADVDVTLREAKEARDDG